MVIRCATIPTRAHPRSRGDHSTNGQAIPGVEGSSPLARGPPRDWGGGCGCGAHPRSRGDHKASQSKIFFLAGSSPLARGPRRPPRLVPDEAGLIPARAGTTRVLGGSFGATGAHPRSRGDHAGRREYEELREGSSPLARGPHLLTWGFTPYISKIESL